MADRRPRATDPDTDAETETDAEGVVLTAPAVGAARPAPTLAEAFTCLCAALQEHLSEDMVALHHIDEIQGWYTNGGANIPVAWRHAIDVLEGVLGVPLGQR